MTGTKTDRYDDRRPRLAAALGLASAALLAVSAARAQVPVDDDGNRIGSDLSPLDDVRIENPTLATDGELTAAELDELIGPIALYPDDLLAVVLPASTYPLQIVQAARFLEQVEADPSLEPDPEWDDSVVALLNYPDVLNMMNEDIDWTWSLGEAVVRQQPDVILAIESFRDRAYAAGNLKTDEYQTVSVDDEGIIEIEPVNDDVIYVPYYEPDRVVYYSPTPVYHYYATPYPVYYYPYPRHHHFRSGFFWGVTTAFTIGWVTDHLHVYHHSYHGHPYYGRYYDFYGSYWRRPSITVYNSWYVNTRSPYYHHRYKRGDYWRPRYRSGARPTTRIVDSRYHRDRDRDRDYRPDRRGDAVYDSRNRRASNTPRLRADRDRRSDGVIRSDRRSTGGSRQRDDTVRPDRRRTTATDRRSVRSGEGDDDRIRFRPRNKGTVTASPERRVRTAASDDRQRSNRTDRRGRSNDAVERRSSRAPASTARAVNTARSETPRRVRQSVSAPRTEGYSAPRQTRSSPVRSRQSAPVQSRQSAPVRSRQSTPVRRSDSSAPTRQSRPAPAPRQRQSEPARRLETGARTSRQAAPRTGRATRSDSRRSGGDRDRSPRRGRQRDRN